MGDNELESVSLTGDCGGGQMTKIGGKGFKAEDVKAMIASKPKLSIAELEVLPKIPTQKLALLWKQQIAESYSGVYTLLTKQDEHKLRALERFML
jgi:hypothetical protein